MASEWDKQPLITPDASSRDGDDGEACNEHIRDELGMGLTMYEIQERFGLGTRLYFDFLKFIWLTNLALSILASVSWFSFALANTSEVFDHASVRNLFVGVYTKKEYPVWMVTNILSIILWFSFGPIFFWYAKRQSAKVQLQEHDNIYALSGMQVQNIPENLHFSSAAKAWRRLFSYLIFIALIATSASVIYLIELAARGQSQNAFHPVNFVVTGFIGMVNLFFGFICGRLTTFEKHATWAAYKTHKAFKLLSFKIINVIAMYAALSFAFGKDKCFFMDAGSKFFALMLTDLFLFGSLEMLIPLGKIWLSRNVKAFKGARSDEEAKPEFDVADEYLEVFYRQFVIYMGMSVFPFITVLGLINNLAEYPLDKFRMVKICQRPKRLDLSLKYLVICWLTITAIAALLSWPQGAVWILSATQDKGAHFQCALLPQ